MSRRVHKWKAFAASTIQVIMLSMVYSAIFTGQASFMSHNNCVTPLKCQARNVEHSCLPHQNAEEIFGQVMCSVQ